MTTRINRQLAVALLAAAGLLAGCGDKDTPESGNAGGAGSGTSSAEQATATTPEEGWAAKLCTAMVAQAKTVQPPNVDTSSPQAAQQGLVKFFADVGDQLSDQVDAVKAVGPPPGAEDEAAWNRAVKRMRATNKKVAAIRRDLRASNPETAGELNKLIAELGDQMKVLTEYQGPVADLSKEKALGLALASEPACAKVS